MNKAPQSSFSHAYARDIFFVEIAVKVAAERIVAAVLLLCAVVAGCAERRAAAVALGAVCILQGCRALLWSLAYRNTRRDAG